MEWALCETRVQADSCSFLSIIDPPRILIKFALASKSINLHISNCKQEKKGINTVIQKYLKSDDNFDSPPQLMLRPYVVRTHPVLSQHAAVVACQHISSGNESEAGTSSGTPCTKPPCVQGSQAPRSPLPGPSHRPKAAPLSPTCWRRVAQSSIN